MRLFLFALIVLSCPGVTLAQSTPVRFLITPMPELPSDYGQLDAEGSVIVRVEFLENGEVGSAYVVKGIVPRLDDLALAAAKRIKFEPASNESQKIKSSSLLQYSYSWRNSGWKGPRNLSTTVTNYNDPTAEAVIAKAVQNLGGDKYLKVTTQVGRGRYSIFKEGAVVSFQSFIDVTVFPDRERTEFKGSKSKLVQTNTGNTGWVYDGDQELIKVQGEEQIANFKRGIRVSLDNLLRGGWKGEAELSYIGKRQASLGKRNEVVKLAYKDGLVVEFEFAAEDGLPMKAIYKSTNADGEEVTEEDRYAQFVDVNGIRSPYIIDRFTNKQPSSRINYESVEYNVRISDSIFAKPSNPKDLKKDLKL